MSGTYAGRGWTACSALTEVAKVLRLEALLAKESPDGKHPHIDVKTHAAALIYAADLLDRVADATDPTS